jgi:hypothetical protein
MIVFLIFTDIAVGVSDETPKKRNPEGRFFWGGTVGV